MLTSKWRVRTHRYLGTVFVPIIDLEIQDARGPFTPFSLCVDSGAVVSLLPGSAAGYLGLDPSAGKPIELGGVGRHALRARLHDLTLRIGDVTAAAPFAIAVTEDVPGLLGRLGVFDRFEITFDPRERQTRITPVSVA